MKIALRQFVDKSITITPAINIYYSPLFVKIKLNGIQVIGDYDQQPNFSYAYEKCEAYPRINNTLFVSS